MPYMCELVGKFERSQLPVGHGGFHIGTLDMNGKFFRYFFDCGGGAAGKKLIETEFEQNKFDFGVVSHFDSDHFSQLRKANVKRVFIPYLEELDLFFLTLTHFVQSDKLVDLSTELAKFARVVQVVMVRHAAPNDNAPDDTLGQAPSGDDIGIVGLKATKQGSTYSISDNENIYVGTKSNRVVTLKFYNHQASKLQTAIRKALEEALTKSATITTTPKKTTTKSGKPTKVPVPPPALSNESNAPYSTVEDFLADVKASPTTIIQKNAARLKAVYTEILNGHGEPGVTASNLSSLTMFSVTTASPTRRYHRDRLFSKPDVAMDYQHHYGYECDGWMLTGDLELTGCIWTGFYEHYHRAIEQCAVFNVPHHGSARAFDDRAIHHITANKHFIFSVNADDEHHPAPTMTALLQSYGVQPDNVTSVNELPHSRFTLTRLFCSEN